MENKANCVVLNIHSNTY